MISAASVDLWHEPLAEKTSLRPQERPALVKAGAELAGLRRGRTEIVGTDVDAQILAAYAEIDELPPPRRC